MPDRLHHELRRAAQLYDQLGALVPAGQPAQLGMRVSGSRDPSTPINLTVAEHRLRLEQGLAWWLWQAQALAQPGQRF